MDYNDIKLKKAIEVLQSFYSVIKETSDFTKKNAHELGMTIQQLSILNALATNSNLTLKNLTEVMSMSLSKSSVSLIVDKLVEQDIVERKSSTLDRRQIILNLTEKGIQLYQQSQSNAYAYKAMLLALNGIDSKDIDLLLTLHDHIIENIKALK
ncbi:MarR family winged helix-turn-helix transcriptional regulator [Paraclostridium bifermentans]|uniref:MarR family winged helix-turn-helix transcriptional regulator n=1 Tax=Paraclostridium bifermentans TaxID=1490 RepID=UPI001FF2188D|nr:MarR family transcriptional regulator [Paraclostridium bifermentans]UOW69692.1 MarR family transcriptional regulator [Paraclostridium bifermentans]